MNFKNNFSCFADTKQSTREIESIIVYTTRKDRFCMVVKCLLTEGSLLYDSLPGKIASVQCLLKEINTSEDFAAF